MFGESTEVSYLKKIDEKLIIINDRLIDIDRGIRRNDTHISFISKIYLMFNKPLKKLLDYFTNNDGAHNNRLTAGSTTIPSEVTNDSFLHVNPSSEINKIV